VSDAEEDEDDLLVRRSDEDGLEDEAYRTFLERQVGADLKELITLDDDDGPTRVPAAEPEAEVEATEEKKKKKKDKKRKRAETEETGAQAKEDADRDFLMKSVPRHLRMTVC
jgi:protein KRI1